MRIKDIAKIAGVSRSTVSRVVNNYSNVSKETRENVMKIIKKHGYVPHASARILAGKSNKMIGVFITNIKHNSKEFTIFGNTYFSPLIAAIIDCASMLKYNVLVLIIDKKSDFEKARQLFYNNTISGGIFVGANNRVPKIYKFIKSGYKLAIFDQEKKDDKLSDDYIIVNSNNLNGAYKAVRHLIDFGHERIAHICGDMKKYSGFKRLEGYKKAMNAAGLPIKEGYIVEGDFTEDSGFNKAKQLLTNNNNITAIFSSNDSMAIGAMKAIKKMGLKIPDDISIIGYDDINIAKYTTPSLTTIDSHILKMASIATENLISFIKTGINPCNYYNIPTKLIMRESTKKIR